jgi:uncharacterized protein with HEPN domain
MRHDPEKSLEDIRDAAEFILDLTRGRTLDEYRNDRVLSSAVERNFITVGEALYRLVRADPDTAAALGNYPQIIAFRNMVVHGYDQIEHPIVWGIIQNEAPNLLAAVRTRLGG